MCHIILSMSITGSLFLCGALQAQDEPFAEAEIVRSEHVSEIKVYIVNPGPRDFKFQTGARGRGGDVPEGEIAGSVTGITVIPKLWFQRNPPEESNPWVSTIEVSAPILRGRWQYRSAPEPEVFVVRPGKRRLYYSFTVPTEYVRGKFAGGYLPRPDLENKTDNIPGYGAPHGMISAIRITRLIDVTDKKAAAKRDESR